MKGIKKILISLVTVAMLLCVGTINVLAEDTTKLTVKIGDDTIVIEKEGASARFVQNEVLDEIFAADPTIEQVGDEYFKVVGTDKYKLYLNEIIPATGVILNAEDNEGTNSWKNERVVLMEKVPVTKFLIKIGSESITLTKEGATATFDVEDLLAADPTIEQVGDEYFKVIDSTKYKLWLNFFPANLNAEDNEGTDSWKNTKDVYKEEYVPTTKLTVKIGDDTIVIEKEGASARFVQNEVLDEIFAADPTIEQVGDEYFKVVGTDKYKLYLNEIIPATGVILNAEDNEGTNSWKNERVVLMEKVPVTKFLIKIGSESITLTKEGATATFDVEDLLAADPTIEQVGDEYFKVIDSTKYKLWLNFFPANLNAEDNEGTDSWKNTKDVYKEEYVPTTKLTVKIGDDTIVIEKEGTSATFDVEDLLAADPTIEQVGDEYFKVIDSTKYKLWLNFFPANLNAEDNEGTDSWKNTRDVYKEVATKNVTIKYVPYNSEDGTPLATEEIVVASDAEKFEATSLEKVTDGVFELDGVKYTTEYNGYIIDNEDGTYTGIVTVIKINNEVETTLFVNLMYGDQYVGQVILHKTSEKNDPVTFKYEDYRDQLTVVANNVKYYVPEEVVGDFAWTLAEGGEAEANVDVIADEKELTLQVDFVYNNSNPIATVYLHKTVLLGESYKFTMEDLEKEVPGLKFVSNNLECLNGEIEFTIPEDFLSGDWAEVSSLETEPHVYASDVVPATEAETKLVVVFKCNDVTVGDTVELVKENLIKTTTYTFTTEDLAGELPGLTFKVGDDVYEVIDADPLSGEWATVTAGDSHTYSVDVLKLAKPAKPSTGGSSSSTTNTTTKPVVNTSAK